MAALDNTDIVALVGAGAMGAGIAQAEVVSGLTTDPQIAQSFFDTAENWGKLAVHTRSTPGFIVNRIARPFYAESLRLLQEGAGDAGRA